MGRKLLALGVMSEIDKAALATYCQAWGRWVEAEQLLATEGLVTVAPNNGYIMPSPYLSIANKAMEQMMKALIEFGMTPSSRSRIKADTSEKDKDPFEEFLGGRRSAP
jgi:P27 family predicted phage terminase small subunit